MNVFLAVDEDRRPHGLILDDSTITSYYWYVEQDGEIEAEGGEWPADAREFNPLTDAEGANPNQGLSSDAFGDQ